MARCCNGLRKLAPWWEAMVVASLLWCASDSCSAQMLHSALSVTARLWDSGTDCANAPPFCEGSTDFLQLGTYEFDIQMSDRFELREARFSLEWPEDWSLREWSNCSSAVVSGDVAIMGSAIHLTFPECGAVGGTALRLVLDCTSPGRFDIQGPPGEDFAGVFNCDEGEWHPEVNWRPHVEIGDYCGRAPEHPCSFCEMGGLVGYFPSNDIQFDLESGKSHVDTLLARAPTECSGFPECGSTEGPCYLGLRATASWIRLRPLSETVWDHWVERTVTTDGLVPGDYTARIVMRSSERDCCGSATCETISLTVRPVSPVSATTWGLIKWRAVSSQTRSEDDSAEPPPPH